MIYAFVQIFGFLGRRLAHWTLLRFCQTNWLQKEKWAFHGAGGLNVKEDKDKVESWRDEELYISGQTVVWSRTALDGVGTVVKTFTMDSPVLQVM